MAACPGIDDVGAPNEQARAAPLRFAPRADDGCDATTQDEGAAPRQTLLHTFSTPIGGMLFVGGLVMIALPGPSLPLLALGLALLSREYAWARRLLDVVARRVPPGLRRFVAVPGAQAPVVVEPLGRPASMRAET